MWEIIIAGAAAIKIPGLIESAAKSVGERLLGPYLDRLAQPAKDRAMQRSRVAQAVADLAAREVSENPGLFKAEVEHLLNQSGARMERIEKTYIKSLGYMAEEPSESATNSAGDPPSDDWLNRWSRYVEDASSEELQDAFARILAGEVKKKGAFSIGTLRLVSEMSMETANDFQIMWSEAIDDYIVRYEKYKRGADWTRLSRLREVGLLAEIDSAIHRPEGRMWGFGTIPSLLIEVDPSIRSEVPIAGITRIGLELGSIMPKPDLKTNLQRLAFDCPDKRGWKTVTLIDENSSQQIWKA